MHIVYFLGVALLLNAPVCISMEKELDKPLTLSEEIAQLRAAAQGLSGQAARDSAQALFADSAVLKWILTCAALRFVHSRPVTHAHLNENDQKLVTVGGEGVLLWDTAKLKRLKEISGISPDCALFLPGDRIAIASTTDRVTIFSSQGKRKLTFPHAGNIFALAADARGLLLASGGEGLVNVWDLSNETLLFRLPQAGFIRSLSFDASGSQLLVTTDELMQVWDMRSGKSVLSIAAQESEHFSYGALHPAGTHIAWTSGNSFVLWDIQRNMPIFKYPEEGKTVCFDKTGSLIAAGLYDGSVIVYDLTGTVRYSLKGHSDAVFSVTFGNAGPHLVSSSRDGKSFLWNLDLIDLLEHGLSLEQIQLLYSIFDVCIQKNPGFRLDLMADQTTVFLSLPPQVQELLREFVIVSKGKKKK